MNNFVRAAPAPHIPQQIYAVARVNIAFVIAPDFYVQIQAKNALYKCSVRCFRADRSHKKRGQTLYAKGNQSGHTEEGRPVGETPGALLTRLH
ncbi:MAG: hypothetical protein E6559_02400 [Pantoea sp.]|uniref:hypothetical protein n=1 Tax=Pantoea septica TaxID=472695 RepID=UPI001C11DDC4|nr:hypothetical protein [Pantoea septica]MBU5377406.1 hypothetical protein [Pantoea septica]MDU5836934.1 hypothetical protein [Pantoea sp.]MDU6438758.1 hypothetical protein [Pantoea sp.]